MINAAKNLSIRPPEYSYFRAPYPILSFLYGLYCDEEWSNAEFIKWRESRLPDGSYAYIGYLDPYLGMPQEARFIVSEEVPNKSPGLPPDGRFLPTLPLAERLWPFLVSELLQEPPAGAAPVVPNRRSARPNAGREALSGLAMIYLENKRGGVGNVGLQARLDAVSESRGRDAKSLNEALAAIKADLVKEFTTGSAPW